MVRRIKAKLVLRLRAEGLTGRQIAAQGMSRHSVSAVLDAADREGVGWDDVAELDEADVYARLFPGRGEHESVHAQPDWDKVHRGVFPKKWRRSLCREFVDVSES